MRIVPIDIVPEARRILRLAWPVVLTSLNWTIMHMIDVAVVAHAGTGELALLGAGRVLTFAVMVMGFSAMTGVLVFAARADGAGRSRETGDFLRAGLLLGLLAGLPCTVALLFFSDELLRLAQVAPEMVDGGAAVARGMALSFPFQFMLAAAGLFLEGISRPRAVALVNLAMLPLNAVLAWAWVGGHFGLPAMGAVGAVLATSVISAIGAAAMIAAAWWIPDARQRGVRDLSRAALWRALRDLPLLARFGSMPAIAAGLEIGGFAILMVLTTRLGEVTAAAFQAVFSLHNLAFSLALGFGSAAGVRTGNAVGEGRPELALPRTIIACVLGALAMLVVGVLFAIFADFVVRPFTDDGHVRMLAATMLALLGSFMFLDGVQVVAVYALRSLGDQVAAGINGILAFFIVTGGSGWLLVERGHGAIGLIWATIAGVFTAALLQGWRLWWVSARFARQAPG